MVLLIFANITINRYLCLRTPVRDIDPVKDPKDENAFNLGEVKLELPAVKLEKE